MHETKSSSSFRHYLETMGSLSLGTYVGETQTQTETETVCN